MSDSVPQRKGREALRGAEAQMFDFIFEALSSEQRKGMLRAPLERAAAMGKRDLAQRLVWAGAEIGNALHDAIQSGHREITSDLLENGASVAAKDGDGCTPLHVAAYQGETEMAQLLLLKGAKMDAFDHFKSTPLCLAARFGSLSTALSLLAAGADVSLRCGQFKAPILHEAALKGHVDILRAVIEHGADVDAVDTSRCTALHLAALFNKAEAIDVLVEAGANIEARNNTDCTPLHHASDELTHEALVCLLKHGAATNARNCDLQTALMIAAIGSRKPGAAGVVDSLLRAGADETLVDFDGNKAADVIGADFRGIRPFDKNDVECVRGLLANAPADRVWRRRGYLVLCRAHPGRMQHNEVISGTHHPDAGQGTTLALAEERVRGSTVDEVDNVDWKFMAAEVVGLREGVIFRTIVEYL